MNEPLDLHDDELWQLVSLCLHELEQRGCRADPAVTSALTKLSAEKIRRSGPLRPQQVIDTNYALALARYYQQQGQCDCGKTTAYNCFIGGDCPIAKAMER